MKSETLSLKAIVSKLDFLNKTVIFQWNTRKKDLQLLATKLTEKVSGPHNAKEEIYQKEKHKISKTVTKYYSVTKTFLKLKFC